MKLPIVLAALLLTITGFACGEKKASGPGAKAATVMLVSAQPGRGFDSLSPGKIEAAFELAARTAMRYSLIPSRVRDSVGDLMRAQGKQATALELGREFSADRIFFIRTDRFVNMVRVEAVAKSAPGYDREIRGVGYALLRYRTENGSLLYDPAILEALQRALANLEKDPEMFAKADAPLNVRPAPPLAIGGIQYIDNDDEAEWRLYKEKVVTSYDAIETIFQTLKDEPAFVTYDIATRDSIFALNRLIMPENYTLPSSAELDALQKFEVERYIAGRLLRTREGAILTLYLGELSKQGLKELKSAEVRIEEDSRVKYREAVESATKKLLR